MTRCELEDNRHKGYRVYGYKHSYCDWHRSCDACDKIIRIGCKAIVFIERLQTKRILRICKDEQTERSK